MRCVFAKCDTIPSHTFSFTTRKKVSFTHSMTNRFSARQCIEKLFHFSLVTDFELNSQRARSVTEVQCPEKVDFQLKKNVSDD